MIWQHGQEELNKFLEHLNSCMDCMKFETETSSTSVNFLDVKLILEEITTTLYTKPTDSHNYINYSSCHPRACKNSIPYSQFLRLRRICSDEDDFVEKSKQLAFYYHQADYPISLIQSSFAKTFVLDRNTMLYPKVTTTEEREKDENRIFLITTYHPTFNNVNDIVNAN